MNTKKKLAISITVLVLAIIAAVISVIGAWAATQQKVANLFTIEYTADNVNATIGVTYIEKDKSWQNAGTGEQLTFNAKEASRTETVTFDKIVLDVENDCVLFLYEFTNNNTKPADSDGEPMYVTLTEFPSISNAVIDFATFDASTFGNTFPNPADVTCDAMKSQIATSDLSQFGYLEVPASSSGYAAFLISIIDYYTSITANSYTFEFSLSSTAPTT